MTVTKLPTKQLNLTPSQAERFVTAAKAACGAVSNDPVRDLLTMVRITVEDDYLVFRSTNSYRANRVTYTLLDAIVPFDVLVYGHELVPSLPSKRDIKLYGMGFVYEPGRALLDPGQITLSLKDKGSRIMYARPNQKEGVMFPDIDSFFTSWEKNDHTNESVAFRPEFLADIGKEAHSLDKDTPVHVTTGSSPLQPVVFTHTSELVRYESLLMPVRIR